MIISFFLLFLAFLFFYNSYYNPLFTPFILNAVGEVEAEDTAPVFSLFNGSQK